MSIFNSTRTSADQSIQFDLNAHPLANLLKVATNTSLSVEARLLYVILVLMAWSKGRCWPSQHYQSEALGRSDRQVRRYHQELEKTGVLGINRRPGQSSLYYPWLLHQTPDTSDLRASDTGVHLTLKEELQNVKNVLPKPTRVPSIEEPPSPDQENVNALKISSESKESTLDETSSPNSQPLQNIDSQLQESPPDPRPTRPKGPSRSKTPLTADHLFLVEEIERTTNDSWSRGHFVNLVRQVDEQTIWSALSVTREKMALESGVNGGAFFTATVRGMAGLQSLNSHRTSPVTSNAFVPRQQPPDISRSASIPEPVPMEEIDPIALVKGWKIVYRPGDVSSVLSQVGRCLPDWNAHSTWESLKQDRAGEPEEEVLDEFLDLAAFKVQFQSTQSSEVAT